LRLAAMLRAREVVAARCWSTSQEPTTEADEAARCDESGAPSESHSPKREPPPEQEKGGVSGTLTGG